MSDNPDAIRSDIEATRARLGTNVDAVADKVTPSNIVQRQTNKVRDAVFGVKEKVMGTAEDLTTRAHTGVHHGTDSAGNALHDSQCAASGCSSGCVSKARARACRERRAPRSPRQ